VLRWDSPWGWGTPGWHLECSVMSIALLGPHFDIHTGGIDHRELHHVNEIAQSEAFLADGLPWVRYWLHNEFLQLGGAKMAKSAGGAPRLADLTEAGYHPLAYRLFLLGGHYRSQLDFTTAAIDAAQATLRRLTARVQPLRPMPAATAYSIPFGSASSFPADLTAASPELAPAAPITARTSSTCSSSGVTPATPSDIPLPRRSKRITREKDARRVKRCATDGISQNISVFDIATDPRHPKQIQRVTLHGLGLPWNFQLDPTGNKKRLLLPTVYGGPIAVGSAEKGEWRTLDKASVHVDWCAADWTDADLKFLLALKHESGGLLLRSRDGGKSFDEVGKGNGPAWVFDADTAVAWGKQGKAVILVRVETNPNDVHGMVEAKGILTQTGGTASHAALVARGMGRPCVVGASSIAVDVRKRIFSANGTTIKEGDQITIDGTTGEVYVGTVPTIEAQSLNKHRAANAILRWADELRRLEVWANADYPRDAIKARENGAQGVGLCRTEHMFMEQERLPIVQAMIMATTTAEREKELAKLLPIQRGDFEGIFKEMAGLPVIIRLIDPPLHEFLPSLEELIRETTHLKDTGENPTLLAEREKILARVEELHEQNPMLGLRGVRLSILYPEITRMQVRAIMEAACNLRKKKVDARPEIMIPLAGTVAELRVVHTELKPVAEAVQKEMGVKVPYKFGTMIEIPRAALTAGEIAQEAEFFSFGTNDLTQTTFGFSRDDAERAFIVRYLEQKILPRNPFETIDEAGVGRLMGIAVKEGRKTRKNMEIGICGEHGGDPDSIHLCHKLGLNYVSCSPFRVPVARLAAAQAAIGEGTSAR